MVSNRNVSQIFPLMHPVPQVLGEPRLLKDVMAQIRRDHAMDTAFNALTLPEREAFLGFCVGNRGLKVTYDPFFHHLFNPATHPDRLDRLLSCIMGQKVKVRERLPRERIRISEESSLLIMDILVQLADGSLVSVEMQKVGYDFPIERSFCYGADLLVRQYDLVKKNFGEKFSYRNMRPVYIIVLMEKSPGVFWKQHDDRAESGEPSGERMADGSAGNQPLQYIHRSDFSFNTGLQMKSLENFIYISLDIFHEMPHNGLTELDAWLYFLSSDKPADILRVVRKYPFFQEIYQDIIYFRYHPKELITMYSEALRIMDKNTVDYMIEEMRNKLQKELRNELQNELQKKLRNELQKEMRSELQKELRSELQKELRNEFDGQLKLQQEESNRQLKLQQEEIQRLHALLAQYEGQNAEQE